MTPPLACSVHPDAPAEGRCRRCGQPFCSSCLSTREGVSLCRACLGTRRLRRLKILGVVTLMVGAPAAFATWTLHERLSSRERPRRTQADARDADQARLQRAEHLHRSGRTAQARLELGRILKDRPLHPGALLALSRLDREARDWEAVLRSTGRILAEHPGAVQARHWQSEALLSLGRPDRAERTLREGLAVSPRSGLLALALAQLLAASKRRPEALDLLREAIKRRPDAEEAALHELLLSLEQASP